MDAPLTCRMLCPADMGQMYRSFSESFTQGLADMSMSRKAFEQRILHKLHIDFDISPGIFSGDKLVGFIFHTQNQYRGKQAAYNGGTGVIPGFTGRRLTKRMYDFVLPALKKRGVVWCVLETITSHHQALKAYHSVGFQKARTLKCFKQVRSPERSSSVLGSIRTEDIDLQSLSSWGEAQPGMGDQLSHIQYHLAYEHVAIAVVKNQKVGYIIYQHLTGRISQMAVKQAYRNRGYGTSLLDFAREKSQPQALTFNNVPEDSVDLIGLLYRCGFENQIDQYEMYLRVEASKRGTFGL